MVYYVENVLERATLVAFFSLNWWIRKGITLFRNSPIFHLEWCWCLVFYKEVLHLIYRSLKSKFNHIILCFFGIIYYITSIFCLYFQIIFTCDIVLPNEIDKEWDPKSPQTKLIWWSWGSFRFSIANYDFSSRSTVPGEKPRHTRISSWDVMCIWKYFCNTWHLMMIMWHVVVFL